LLTFHVCFHLQRTELVKEKDLEDMDENERRKLCACINIIENHEVHEAWHTWRSLVDHLRRKDLEKFSATQIQRTWRGEMARTRVFLLRQEQAQKEALLRAVRVCSASCVDRALAYSRVWALAGFVVVACA